MSDVTLIKSILLSSISAGGRLNSPRQPNIWCGDPKNGYLPGDLIDANGLADFIIENDVLHDDPAFEELRGNIDDLRQYVDDRIAALINGSPEWLDTLAEIAQAIGNDPDFITTILDRIDAIEQESAEKNAHVDGDNLIINI